MIAPLVRATCPGTVLEQVAGTSGAITKEGGTSTFSLAGPTLLHRGGEAYIAVMIIAATLMPAGRSRGIVFVDRSGLSRDRPVGVSPGPLEPRFRVAAVVIMLAFCAAPPSAPAQSSETIDGMRAYNTGQLETAYRLLKHAADLGDAEAQVNLGYFYARGQVVGMDQREAFRLYAMSANQGNSEGMNALGYKYNFGTGVQKDMGRAVYWYCQAIAQGNPRAMNNLAQLLAAGDELARDIAQARDLWRQSAALGHSNSAYNLGLSYLNGPEAERDPRAANDWVLQAARSGQAEAENLLRQNNYAGPLPPPSKGAALMIPGPRNAAGHAKICGAPVS
jgi:hypothetical protein